MQGDVTAGYFYLDVFGFYLSIAFERFPDAMPDVEHVHHGTNPLAVVDTRDASQATHQALGRITLGIKIDCPLQAHVAFFDLELDVPEVGNCGSPGENFYHAASDLVEMLGWFDLDFALALLRFGGLWQGHGKNALRIIGGDVVGINAVRQSEGPLE